MTLSGATTPGQSGSGSNGNEEVLYIPQIFKAGVLPSGGLVSYSGHSLRQVGEGERESYLPAEMQSDYSTAPAKLANKSLIITKNN